MIELMGFWEYDQFPFCLGGQVTQIRGDGCIETVEFGKGNWFRPWFFLPVPEGRVLKVQLRELEEGHKKAQQVFEAEWTTKLTSVMPEVAAWFR